MIETYDLKYDLNKMGQSWMDVWYLINLIRCIHCNPVLSLILLQCVSLESVGKHLNMFQWMNKNSALSIQLYFSFLLISGNV